MPTWGVFLDEENQGGGPLIDIGTHALDLTLWEMNNYEPAMVRGQRLSASWRDNENAANAWGSWDPKKFTVEDSAFGFISMKNGATIVLESTWALNTLDWWTRPRPSCAATSAGADMLGPDDNPLRINGEALLQDLYTTEPDLKIRVRGLLRWRDGRQPRGDGRPSCGSIT